MVGLNKERTTELIHFCKKCYKPWDLTDLSPQKPKLSILIERLGVRYVGGIHRGGAFEDKEVRDKVPRPIANLVF